MDRFFLVFERKVVMILIKGRGTEKLVGVCGKVFPVRFRKGFTLIELLVVISIIALLLSILMPGLQKAKGKAQQVVCQSNLKQFNLAAFLWADDNDGWVLPATWDWEEDKLQGIEGNMLYSYLAIDQRGKGVTRCPGLKESRSGEARGESGDPFFQYYGGTGGNEASSYGLNHHLVSLDDDSWDWGPNNVHWNEHGNIKLDKIRNPGKKIHFMDCTVYLSRSDFWANRYPGATEIDKGRRHMVGGSRSDAGKANILWVDGHVSIEPDDWEEVKAGEDEYEFTGRKYFTDKEKSN